MRQTFLPYSRPDLGDEEVAAVAESMRNGWLTTGPQTAALEAEFAQAADVPYTVALNSCTAGLHLGLIALGVGRGDEVVMPSLTFAAGAQCTMEIGAHPVFCDVDPETLSLSIATIEPVVTPRTKAIVAMPYAGRPIGMEELCAFAHARGIAVLEDAAHGAGTLDRGRWPGAHADAATYSFYATKNLATGEGGMFVTHDAGLADRVRTLSLHGMSRDAWKRYTQRGTWRYDIVEPGYKYNLPDLAASIGRVQLRRLAGMQDRRDRIAARYRTELGGIAGLGFQREPDHAGDRASWCMFVVLVDARRAGLDRDAVVDRLRDANVGTSVHYIPTHTFSAYRDLPRAPLPVTEDVAGRLLSLPLYPSMSDADVDDVIEAMRCALAFDEERGDYAKPILIA